MSRFLAALMSLGLLVTMVGVAGAGQRSSLIADQPVAPFVDDFGNRAPLAAE
ncbi:hypothetical protein [Brevundimonas sp.]|jgi:hypothetical protein|uniref:hypothetical protein n=1 Tax=Brevundimonas sp. TaxID=1871086 RepID=UPI002E0E66F1|nr:hypothetical protein [Brevundimonas sp.]